MSRAARIQDCIDHHDKYVQVLAAMPDLRLCEKLDTIHLQMELAEQKRDTAALELLEIWRAQTIEARTYKAENNIPDQPNEIEEAIAGIETYIAEPEPQIEIKDEPAIPVRRKPQVTEDKSEQLTFF
jgi:hypothetical protein